MISDKGGFPDGWPHPRRRGPNVQLCGQTPASPGNANPSPPPSGPEANRQQECLRSSHGCGPRLQAGRFRTEGCHFRHLWPSSFHPQDEWPGCGAGI